jgi:hypothetical protein
MKKQLLIGLILINSILTINAQIRVPENSESPIWYTNGNVGIGTGIAGSLLTLENSNSPTVEFKTSGTSDLLISGSTGSTVINSLRTNPIHFQINSERAMTIAQTGSLLTLENSNIPTIEFKTSGTSDLLISGSTGSTIINSLRTNPIYFQINSNNVMAISGVGNVGIGTSNPDTKLAVKGTIHAEEVKVDLNVPAPDYVFNSDYKLKDLTEIKEFINCNKHLPEVPTAVEMNDKGVNIGDLQMILLKKIEELTLYSIQQSEDIKTLKQKIEELESK